MPPRVYVSLGLILFFAYYRLLFYVVRRLLFTFACRQLRDNFTFAYVTFTERERVTLNVYAFIHLFIFFPLILKSFLGLLLKKKKVFEKLAALNSRFSSPFFFRDSEAFDKRRLREK